MGFVVTYGKVPPMSGVSAASILPKSIKGVIITSLMPMPYVDHVSIGQGPRCNKPYDTFRFLLWLFNALRKGTELTESSEEKRDNSVVIPVLHSFSRNLRTNSITVILNPILKSRASLLLFWCRHPPTASIW